MGRHIFSSSDFSLASLAFYVPSPFLSASKKHQKVAMKEAGSRSFSFLYFWMCCSDSASPFTRCDREGLQLRREIRARQQRHGYAVPHLIPSWPHNQKGYTIRKRHESYKVEPLPPSSSSRRGWEIFRDAGCQQLDRQKCKYSMYTMSFGVGAVRRYHSRSSYQSKAAHFPSVFGLEQDNDGVNPNPLINDMPCWSHKSLDQSGQIKKVWRGDAVAALFLPKRASK